MSLEQAIRIEITSSEVKERRGKIGKGPRAGEDYCIREQTGYLHNGEPYPVRFRISLRDAIAFQPGMYVLGASSVVVGEYDALTIGRDLVLLKDDVKPALAKAS